MSRSVVGGILAKCMGASIGAVNDVRIVDEVLGHCRGWWKVWTSLTRPSSCDQTLRQSYQIDYNILVFDVSAQVTSHLFPLTFMSSDLKMIMSAVRWCVHFICSLAPCMRLLPAYSGSLPAYMHYFGCSVPFWHYLDNQGNERCSINRFQLGETQRVKVCTCEFWTTLMEFCCYFLHFYTHLYIGPLAIMSESTASKASRNHAFGLSLVTKNIVAIVHIIVSPQVSLTMALIFLYNLSDILYA